MKKTIWKWLTAAGYFVLLTGCHSNMRAFAAEAAAGSRLEAAPAGAEEPGENGELVVDSRAGCRRLLMETVSAATGPGRHEIFVTGKDYEPETLVIAQIFPETVNISNTKTAEYEKDGHRYVTCRIGFERRNGPGSGEPEQEDGSSFWSVGDVQTLGIGGRKYRFRCVDENYGDANSNHERNALFLCETVIRSDIGSSGEQRIVLPFGETNNYKRSQVRDWLSRNLDPDNRELAAVRTGVNYAFEGKTADGAFGDFLDSDLKGRRLPIQVSDDRLFLLSLEEALRYRETLWTLSGGTGPYRRGYWLRTPVYLERDGRFVDGDLVYAVDAERGCIRPASVTDGEIGIRPAFCLPQAW